VKLCGHADAFVPNKSAQASIGWVARWATGGPWASYCSEQSWRIAGIQLLPTIQQKVTLKPSKIFRNANFMFGQNKLNILHMIS
jgi:hypothetical protein